MKNFEKQHVFFSRIKQSASPEAMAVARAES
jgi:hypothetical protein